MSRSHERVFKCSVLLWAWCLGLSACPLLSLSSHCHTLTHSSTHMYTHTYTHTCWHDTPVNTLTAGRHGALYMRLTGTGTRRTRSRTLLLAAWVPGLFLPGRLDELFPLSPLFLPLLFLSLPPFLSHSLSPPPPLLLPPLSPSYILSLTPLS